jgi:hypothetical protein
VSKDDLFFSDEEVEDAESEALLLDDRVQLRPRGPRDLTGDPLWVPPEGRTDALLHPYEIEVRRVCHFKKRGERKRGCARCGKPKGDRDHAGVPPSFNAGGSGTNRFTYQNTKKLWEGLLIEQLTLVRLPKPLGGVDVEGIMGFPDRTRRDQGNFRVLIEKILGDALVEGGWLEDDSWDYYEFGGLAARYDKGESWTRLMILPRWPPEEKKESEAPERNPLAGQAALPL